MNNLHSIVLEKSRTQTHRQTNIPKKHKIFGGGILQHYSLQSGEFKEIYNENRSSTNLLHRIFYYVVQQN